MSDLLWLSCLEIKKSNDSQGPTPSASKNVVRLTFYYSAHDDNAEYGGNMDTLKTRIKVHHTGHMMWLAPLFLKAKCYIDVKDFPFDTQMCYLKFGSWTHPLTAINLQAGGIDTSE